jgi:hypothetical protein
MSYDENYILLADISAPVLRLLLSAAINSDYVDMSTSVGSSTYGTVKDYINTAGDSG